MRKYLLLILIMGIQYTNVHAQLASSINYNMNVSELGGLNLTLPIKVPPGVNGLQPDLTIGYNSQYKAGLLSTGWDIEGLSSIRRTSARPDKEFRCDPVDFDNNDVYSLDGQSLRALPGGFGSYYQWEADIRTFNNIESFGSSGLPAYFVVETPEGLRYEYGNTTDSKVEMTGVTGILEWKVNKIKDKFNNEINFIYSKDAAKGRSVISSIQYNNAGSGAQTVISFQYTSRTDVNKFWVNGGEVVFDILLSSITVTDQGTMLNKFEPVYDQADGYSRLTEIKQYARNNAQLPSMKITWGTSGDPAYMMPSMASTYISYYDRFATGDYDGDGLTDIFKFPSASVNGSTYELLKSNGNSEFTVAGTGSFPTAGLNSYEIETLYDAQLTSRTICDWNGDGKDDIILFTRDDQSTSLKVFVLISNGTNFTVSNTPVYDKITSTNGYIANMRWTIGDFDGDGRKEILMADPVYSGSTITSYSCRIIGYAYSGYGASSAGTIPNPISRLYAVDMDGDGRDEVFNVAEDGNCYVHNTNIYFDASHNPVLTGGVFSPTLATSGGYPGKNHRIFFGDFNGDGKKDVLTWISGSGWQIGYSKGNGFSVVSGPALTNVDPDASATDDNYVVADFDGDGKDDILQMDAYSTSVNRFDLFFSKGTGSFVKETTDLSNTDFPISIFRVRMGDFNGDGQAEIITSKEGTSGKKIITFRARNNRQTVSAIDDGKGRNIDIYYNYLTTFSGYTAQSGAAFPYVQNTIPLKVVGQIYDNQNFSTYYEYEGLMSNRYSKTLLGFNTRRIKDYYTSRLQTMTYDLNSFSRVVPVSVSVKELSSSVLLNSKQYQYGELCWSFNPGCINKIIYPLATSSKDFVKGTSEQINYSYNTGSSGALQLYGRPDKVTTNIGVDQTTVVDITYALSDPYFYNKSKPAQIITTITRSGQPAYIRKKTFTYNVGGKIAQLIMDPTTSMATTSTYTYNNYGFLTNETKSGTGISVSHVTNYTPSANRRFVSSSSNALGQTEYFTQDWWGNNTSTLDVNGVYSYKEYDEIGRVNKSISSTGAVERIKYMWGNTLGNQPTWAPLGVALIRTVDGIAGNKEEYYDIYGQLLRKTKLSYQSNTMYEDFGYTNLGQYAWRKLPYSITNPALTTIFKYDNYGREVYRQDPSTSITTSYGLVMQFSSPVGMTKKVQDNSTGLVKGMVFDGTGKTTRVEENGTDVIYTYHSNGEIQKVGSSVSPVLNMFYSYDNWGNKTSVTVPNAGTTTTNYNAFRQIINQTDGNSNTYQFQYDALGRMIQKTGPDGTYIYQYDISGAIGKLSKQIAPNGTEFTYGYDAYGRLINEAQLIAGQNYSTDYDFDVYGRKTAVTYPTGDRIKLSYGSHGYFTGVKRDNGPGNDNILYKLVDQNDFGQPLKEQFGLIYGTPIPPFPTPTTPTLTTTTAYNILGMTQYSETYNDLHSFNISDVSYGFDPVTKNLQNYSDNLRNLVEDYSYDAFNRLTSVKQSGAASGYYDINYDIDGNITRKEDISPDMYQYSQYAVTALTNANTSIPSLTQNVSYTPFNLPAQVDEGSNSLMFTYGPDQQRVVSEEYNAGTFVKRKTYLTNFELIQDGAGTREVCYVWGEKYPVAMLVRTNGGPTTVYLLKTDYKGSITHVMDEQGNVVEEKSFDSWGRLRNPADWSYNGVPQYMYDRGFTGHEHHQTFGIINMNARLYDPVIARMYSADPFITNRFNSQAYNLYSYCENNPGSMVDKDGRFLGTAFTFLFDFFRVGFTKGGFEFWNWGKEGFNNAWTEFDPTAKWSRTSKAFDIDWGAFIVDENRTFAGQAFQLISRHTWQGAQTNLGKAYSHIRNAFGGISDVSYYGGAVLVNSNDNEPGSWGLTLGNYINGRNVEASPDDAIFRHEFGHTLQSGVIGPHYITQIGIPSLIGSGLEMLGLHDHNQEWMETQANRMAYNYFSRFEPNSVTNWNFTNYPTTYNPDWYWIYSHPQPIFFWWFFF